MCALIARYLGREDRAAGQGCRRSRGRLPRGTFLYRVACRVGGVMRRWQALSVSSWLSPVASSPMVERRHFRLSRKLFLVGDTTLPAMSSGDKQESRYSFMPNMMIACEGPPCRQNCGILQPAWSHFAAQRASTALPHVEQRCSSRALADQCERDARGSDCGLCGLHNPQRTTFSLGSANRGRGSARHSRFALMIEHGETYSTSCKKRSRFGLRLCKTLNSRHATAFATVVGVDN